MALYRDQGVALRTVKLGETDRIVTLFTQAHGKIRAVAKGVRRPGSRFGAALEPMSHVAVQCYEGRNLDVVTQAETVEVYRGLWDGYRAFTQAVPMLEAVDHLTQEREPDIPLYRMLVGALRTLADSGSPVVAPAFFWKLLALEGFHPMLDACVHCGAEDGPFPRFDLADGGVCCEGCGSLAGTRLSPDTLDLMRRILGGDLRGALDEPDGPSLDELKRLGVANLEYHLERRLRSATLLRAG